MVGPPRKPGPGPWRYGGLKTLNSPQPKSTGTPAQVFRPTVITQWRPKQWYGDPIFPNIATLTANQDLVLFSEPASEVLRSRAFPSDLVFPNLAALIPAVVPPAGPTDAGRHHKRYKVILGSRTAYFATKAEAVTARERHREVIILEAKAAGIDPKKISVRTPRITKVKNWRHPEPVATPVENHPEILSALREAQMREEEEVAIALLLMR